MTTPSPAAPAAGSPEAVAAAAALAATQTPEAIAAAAAAAAAAAPAPTNFAPPTPPVAPGDGENIVVYKPTGDTGLDLALNFVGQLGFGPDRPEIKAAQTGDFTKLEATLKGMGDKAKGYEPYLKIATESRQRVADAFAAKEAATNKVIVDAAGGQEAWNAIHAWVSAEADDQQKADITQAFKVGGFAAQSMASQLAAMYRQSGKSTLPPKGAAAANAATAGASTGGGAPMTRQEYTAEISKLEAKHGYRLTDTPEYKVLSARYLASLKQ
jgi:hypothetical protein